MVLPVPGLPYFDEVYEALDLLLDAFEADERVELRHKLLKRAGFGLHGPGLFAAFRLRFRGGLRRLRPRGLLDEGGLRGRDVVEGVERALRGLDSRALAHGLEPGGEIADILGLGLAQLPVRRGEGEQEVRHHAHEDAGVVKLLLCVPLRKAPEEHGRQRRLRGADAARQVPEQGRGRLLPLGVQRVVRRDLAFSDGAGAAPEAQRRRAHEAVELRGRGPARGALKGLGVGNVFTMQFAGRASPN